MKKIIFASILILIFATTFVKNSTKGIEDKIFTINENIRLLKAELGDMQLEHNYLSSPEKLTELQSKYFENDLFKIDITKIKKIIIREDHLEITNLTEKIQLDE